MWKALRYVLPLFWHRRGTWDAKIGSCFCAGPKISAVDTGSALLEAAFVAPVLIMSAFSTAIFGTALSDKQILVEATRYATRRTAAQWVSPCNSLATPISEAFVGCTLTSSDTHQELTAGGLLHARVCEYISNSVLSPRTWYVITKVTPGVRPILSVEIQIAESESNPLNPLIANNVLVASSAFLIEKECQ